MLAEGHVRPQPVAKPDLARGFVDLEPGEGECVWPIDHGLLIWSLSGSGVTRFRRPSSRGGLATNVNHLRMNWRCCALALAPAP